MRWIVKTSLDGQVFDELLCDGPPCVPESGCSLLIPVGAHYEEGIVSEIEMDQKQTPALLRIVCLRPDTYARSQLQAQTPLPE